jgi:hypothetical protein
LKPYQFPIPRKARSLPDKPVSVRAEREQGADEPLTPVQGRVPGSREEWRVAMALESLGIEYRYQIPLRGGRQVRGGMVLDFLVIRPPEEIPMSVQGRYWHHSIEEERLYLEALKSIYGVEPIVLWSDDLTSVDEAKKVLRRELNL